MSTSIFYVYIHLNSFPTKTKSAGSPVFRQGDIGDALYIIYRGSVAIFFNGKQCDRRLTGDCVGEVALTLSNARVADVISEVHIIYMHIYICVCIYVRVYIYDCIFMYINVYFLGWCCLTPALPMSSQRCVSCICIYIHVCVYIHLYIYMFVYILFYVDVY